MWYSFNVLHSESRESGLREQASIPVHYIAYVDIVTLPNILTLSLSLSLSPPPPSPPLSLSLTHSLSHTHRALMTKLLNPLQTKIEEWKKTAVQMDREHEKGALFPEIIMMIIIWMPRNQVPCYNIYVIDLRRKFLEIRRVHSFISIYVNLEMSSKVSHFFILATGSGKPL